MIVNIRGTSGSGKSYLVQDIMRRCGEQRAVHVEGRKRPYYYLLTGPTRPLWVVGHYDTACGGCDTVKTVPQVYDQVRSAVDQGHNVLYEGIMVAEDANHFLRCFWDIGDRDTFRVINLKTPIEDCLAAVRGRREARGDERPFSEKNTRTRVKRINSAVDRLKRAGVQVESLDRVEALGRVRLLLGA